jgi:hypothetical protein
MKLKSFCRAVEAVTTLKRQPTEFGENFATYTSDKGLVTRINRELKKLTPKMSMTQ